MLTGRDRRRRSRSARGGVRAVPAEQLDAAVAKTVDGIVTKSVAVVALGKAAFYAAEDLPLDAALDHLQLGLTAVAMTDDAAEGVAAFQAKRTPEWKDR